METLEHIASVYGTPGFIFDERVLKERISYLRRSLPQAVGFCYAVKANAFLVPCASQLMERLEICSPGEYAICRRYGVSTSQMVLSGVNKTLEYVTLAVTEDLRENGECRAIYTVESTRQAQILEKVASQLNVVLPVLLRYSSGNQFGMSVEDLTSIVKKRQINYPNLFIRGIQYFSGTQRRSMKKNTREIVAICQLMDELERCYGFQCDEVEYGTGFPVCYFQGEVLDEDEFFREFSELLLPLTARCKVTLEIGRSIAASCGSYAAKVVDLKTVAGQNYAILDGGIHQLVYYGQTMAMRQPYYTLFRAGEKTIDEDAETKEWNLCGSLCTINDILVKQLTVKGLQEGDIFLFRNTGAYSVTEGISLFLSRELPKVILIKENGRTVIARDTLETFTLNS